MYTIRIDDNFGDKDLLLYTNDKDLAIATKEILNKTLDDDIKVVLLIDCKEEQSPVTWWYDDNFSLSFLLDLWEDLRNKGYDPSYC